jgi:hypothetical protein
MKRVGNLELYSSTDIKNLPDYEWLVDSIFPMTGVAILFGESRVGKSFLALDLAVSISQGRSWFGYGVKKSEVIYIAAEAPSGMKNRITAIESYRQIETSENLVILLAPVDLTDDTAVDTLIDVIHETAKVVIVDTFNASTPGIDENSSRDMGKVLSSMRRIVLDTECLLIFVHHCGHNMKDRPRGHSSLQAATDTRILVSKKGRTSNWKVEAQREAESSLSHEFSLQPVDVSSGRSCVVIPGVQSVVLPMESPGSKNQRIVLGVIKEIISDSGQTSVTLEDIRTRALSSIHSDQKHFNQRVNEALEGLRRSGQIVSNPDGTYSIP